jgi:hypothetical protein
MGTLFGGSKRKQLEVNVVNHSVCLFELLSSKMLSTTLSYLLDIFDKYHKLYRSMSWDANCEIFAAICEAVAQNII